MVANYLSPITLAMRRMQDTGGVFESLHRLVLEVIQCVVLGVRIGQPGAIWLHWKQFQSSRTIGEASTATRWMCISMKVHEERNEREKDTALRYVTRWSVPW